MAADESGETRVTQNEGGSPQFAAPDGRSIYSRQGLTGTLWSVSTESGKEKAVTTAFTGIFYFFTGRSLLFVYRRWRRSATLLVASLPGEQTVLDPQYQDRIRGFRSPLGSQMLVRSCFS